VAIHGYQTLTVEAIAVHAQVSKATIYRRWGSKSELMLDAMQIASAGVFLGCESKNLRDGLAEQMRALIGFLNGEHAQALRAVFAAVQSDMELADRFREVWTAKRKAVMDGILRSAVERGEIDPDADLELLIDLLWGPIYYRFFSSFELIEQCLVDRVLDRVLPLFVLSR
jgi:AcrR family transcriptional regulator